MALQRDERGWCVFAGEETDSASYCQMQRATSLQALPETCQSYPRMAVSTPAGLYITLMYTCPAAVRALLRENALGEVSPRGVMAARPCLQGVKILPQAKPAFLSQACAGQWEAFDTFWRWTVRWMAQPEWTPAEALYLIGQLVEQIEARGQAVRTMEGLTDVIEQFAETPAERFRAELNRLEPLTELGLVYLNILLNMLEHLGKTTPFGHAILQILRQGPESPQRRELAKQYDRRIRSRLPEFATIERNFLGSRLFANPLIYRSRLLRIGYFMVALEMIGLRFFALMISMNEDKPLDESMWLRAAQEIDGVMQHDPTFEERLIELLSQNATACPISNLTRPVMF